MTDFWKEFEASHQTLYLSIYIYTYTHAIRVVSGLPIFEIFFALIRIGDVHIFERSCPTIGNTRNKIYLEAKKYWLPHPSYPTGYALQHRYGKPCICRSFSHWQAARKFPCWFVHISYIPLMVDMIHIYIYIHMYVERERDPPQIED